MALEQDNGLFEESEYVSANIKYHLKMSFLQAVSWNFLGLGKSLAVKALRGSVHGEDSDIFYLMKTKLNDVVGLVGGLFLCWKVGIGVEIFRSNLSIIMAKFSNILHGVAWLGVCVCPFVRSNRMEFWKHLSLEVIDFSFSWFLLANLNCVSD
ncbi:hypothetical protein G4B88_002785 [Cannabis sativa]|uniref:Uncharacterized protein n=1 Tax=Cannabis sativa TaxID=3483 RepID=A0A7J6HJQ2_CANSA|nr:hypothetical protein G4B88_002785 [Cannabis sativa]